MSGVKEANNLSVTCQKNRKSLKPRANILPESAFLACTVLLSSYEAYNTLKNNKCNRFLMALL